MVAFSGVTVATNGGIDLVAGRLPCLKIGGTLVPPGLTLVVRPASPDLYANGLDLGRRWIGGTMKRRTSPATAATPLATRERIAAERWMCESSFAGAVL